MYDGLCAARSVADVGHCVSGAWRALRVWRMACTACLAGTCDDDTEVALQVRRAQAA
eukprot:SAG11_NODE_38976_length_244_cov_11.379310_1_plen_56_part_01